MAGIFENEPKILLAILLGPIAIGLVLTFFYVNCLAPEPKAQSAKEEQTYADPPPEGSPASVTGSPQMGAACGGSGAGYVIGELGTKFGLEPGDCIVQIDGQKLVSEEQGRALIEALRNKKSFSISLLRNGERMTFNYHLR